MKKKITALLCAAALSLSLLMVPTSASGLFFLALNDTLAPQSAQYTPIHQSGWVYVPVTVFTSRTAGVNFGINYDITNGGTNLALYDLTGKSVNFNLQDGTATAAGGDPPVPSRVIQRNGQYYVPAYALCRYFGLTYSYNNTEYGPILRITNGGASMTDAVFLSSANSMMRSRYNSYYGESTEPQPPQPPQPPAVIEPEEVEDAPRFSMYLGLRAAQGTDITPALDALANIRATAVVFFPAESLPAMADQIRQAAGRGHRVGLIPVGDTPEARLNSVEAGREILAEILRQETWFVLASDEALAEAGCLCWSPGHTPSTGGSSTQIYERILDFGEGTSGGRILLDSRIATPVLTGVLNQLAEDGDTFLHARETRY